MRKLVDFGDTIVIINWHREADLNPDLTKEYEDLYFKDKTPEEKKRFVEIGEMVFTLKPTIGLILFIPERNLRPGLSYAQYQEVNNEIQNILSGDVIEKRLSEIREENYYPQIF